MKDGVVVLNFARNELTDNDAMRRALLAGKVKRYVCDFPNEETINMEHCIALPHLGASTEESEDNCAVMAAIELDNYLRYGNIKNSVNFPNVEMPMSTGVRVCVLHANVPSIISQVTTILSEGGVNIENFTNKSKGDNAYSVLDITGDVSDAVAAKIEEIADVYKVRVIK
jgi:D-3-phosphoglycerate dehydrogenase